MCADSPAPYAGGPRGIDHLVVAGRDLDGLAHAYRALGFTVGARNRHPWGTENHIVQFDGCFLELIGLGAAAAIPARRDRVFSFGAFVRDYLAVREGMAMLALESQNAMTDAAAFKAGRIGDFEPFFFERMARRPDTSDVRVAFSLAFAEFPGAPQAGFFVCQQHEPQNFWNAALQVHANGVSGIQAVTLVATDPSDYHEFLGPFIGQRHMRATSFGLELDTGRGLVEVLSPTGFSFRFGMPAPDVTSGPLFAAVTFATAKGVGLEAGLRQAKVAHRTPGEARIVLEKPLNGLALAFTIGS